MTIQESIHDFKYQINRLNAEYIQSNGGSIKLAHDYIYYMRSIYYFHIKRIASYSIDYAYVLMEHVKHQSLCYNPAIIDKVILDNIISQLVSIPECKQNLTGGLSI